jgi:hypothetical protein
MKFNLDVDEFQDPLLCSAWVATAIVGSAVIGAGASIYGSSKAVDAQRDAAATGAAVSREQYNTTRNDLAPYRDMGSRAGTELEARLPHLTSDIDVTKELQDPNSTPFKAYDFTRTQGLKATQNSAAARGLGNSGAALKGAATFATGLADNTYKSLFDMENTNRTNAYSRLKGLVDTGTNASAMTGTLGEKSAWQQGQLAVGAGNAEAAAYNAMGGAVKSAANNIGGYAAYKGLYGGGGTPAPASNAGYYGSNYDSAYQGPLNFNG